MNHINHMNYARVLRIVLIGSLFFGSFSSSHTYSLSFPSWSFTDQIQDFCSSFKTSFQETSIAQYKSTEYQLDPEIIEEIQEILRDIGIENYQDICIVSLKESIGANAYALKPFWGCDKYIFVHPRFFYLLSKQERRFLVAHEAMHLKFNHTPKRLLVQNAMGLAELASFGIILYLLRNRLSVSSYKLLNVPVKIFFALLLTFPIEVAMTFGKLKYLQSQEYEADAGAFDCVSCDGGIMFLERTLEKELIQEASNPLTYYVRRYTTHPKSEDRIAALKNMHEKYKTPQDRLNDTLFDAIEKNDLAAIEIALQQGAQIDGNRYSITPLQLAASLGRNDILNTLIKNGASLDAVDLTNRSALYHAVCVSNMQGAQMLLQAGADVNCKRCDGYTPLFVASYLNNAQMMNLLLEYGADIHVKAYENWTALHLAAQTGAFNAVQFLVLMGADIFAIAGPQNLTPEELAYLMGNNECGNFLKGLAEA